MLVSDQSFQSTQKKLKNLATRVFKGHTLVLSQTTPYDTIYQQGDIKVRHYVAAQRRFKEPLVFVAPLAINMSIYDLFPYRSLVKYFNQAGFEVYLIDWGKMGYAQRHLNFLDFIDQYIPACISAIKQHAKSPQITLHGWSMAGLFVSLYYARHQDPAIKNLIVLGSPIDSFASGQIGELYQQLNQHLQHYPKLHHYLTQHKIPNAITHSSGLLNAIGFKILDPRGWYLGHKQFLTNLLDIQALEEHATMGNFLNHMVDYPGGVNQDMLFNVWLQNPLAQGQITLHGQSIELKNIDCPIFIGAGMRDQMVTAAAVEPLTQLISSSDISFKLIPGGHLGLMSNAKSAEEFWPFLAQWLSVRSTKVKT